MQASFDWMTEKQKATVLINFPSVKHELNELRAEKTKGATLRCKTNWTFLGEKPMKYFLNLEKKRAQNKTIHRLQLDNGEIVTGKRVLK